MAEILTSFKILMEGIFFIMFALTLFFLLNGVLIIGQINRQGTLVGEC